MKINPPLPRCPGCDEELLSEPRRGDTIFCRCGMVSACRSGKQLTVLYRVAGAPERKREDGK